MGGWFRKEIKTVEDLKGLKFRCGGMAGQVLAKLGVVPQQIPPADIYPALEKGTIDAAEWIGPYDDEKLGFVKIAPYYYYPGWWEGSANGHLFISTSKWAELPKTYQQMVTIAAGQVAADLSAKYDSKNAPAIKRLVAAGAQLRPFSAEIMDAAYNAANELYAEISAKNPMFKKLHDSVMAFRNEQYSWLQVCEATYDNYMIRHAQPHLTPVHPSRTSWRFAQADLSLWRPHGMVTSPHSLASAAGVDVLRAGGSAIDAAIATSAVLAVVYPHMTGIGGDAFWLIHDGKTGKVRYLNGGGRAAASAQLSWFEAKGLHEIPFRGIIPATLTVPGAVASWTEAHAAYGRLPLSSARSRVPIDYARNGFPVTERLASFIAMTHSELAQAREPPASFLPMARHPRRAPGLPTRPGKHPRSHCREGVVRFL